MLLLTGLFHTYRTTKHNIALEILFNSHTQTQTSEFQKLFTFKNLLNELNCI